MAGIALRDLAVPSVCLLICFLAYSSQYLFYHLEPGPLTSRESAWFNGLVAALWWSYERSIRTDPGRLPKKLATAGEENERDAATKDEQEIAGGVPIARKGRWCKKCNAVKPPRAHHCRQCGRCIPKMDHHCPWTSNCVSHTTFPHFIRFVALATLSLIVLSSHIITRLTALYHSRNTPAYLGPSAYALAHLLVLTVATTLIFFALTILLVTAAYSLAINTTMIETWEIERHDALVEKSRYLGGYVYAPGGRRVRVTKQEFPYDIGIWKNLVQGMGTSNVLLWIMPFGDGPSNESGWAFETNGFEDEGTIWPPIDPDKLPRPPPQQRRREGDGDAFIHGRGEAEGLGEVQAFRKRQEADYRRWEGVRDGSGRTGGLRSSDRRGYVKAADFDDEDEYESDDHGYEEGMDGEGGWTSRDGSRLRDFGVDEDSDMDLELEKEAAADPFMDDDVPLGELIRRRKIAQSKGMR